MTTILAKEPCYLLACKRNLLERQVDCIEEQNDFDWRIWLDVDSVEGTEGEDFHGLVVIQQFEVVWLKARNGFACGVADQDVEMDASLSGNGACRQRWPGRRTVDENGIAGHRVCLRRRTARGRALLSEGQR
jgi:uncharacterized protein with NAD-binding domain and iron-sulfur cluster